VTKPPTLRLMIDAESPQPVQRGAQFRFAHAGGRFSADDPLLRRQLRQQGIALSAVGLSSAASCRQGKSEATARTLARWRGLPT
jgi:hypothetical protein